MFKNNNYNNNHSSFHLGMNATVSNSNSTSNNTRHNHFNHNPFTTASVVTNVVSSDLTDIGNHGMNLHHESIESENTNCHTGKVLFDTRVEEQLIAKFLGECMPLNTNVSSWHFNK